MKTPCANDDLCTSAVETGNLALYEMVFKRAGVQNEGHAHTYHHLTYVVSGRVRVESNGRSREFGPLTKIWIPRGVAHIMTALEPFTVVLCLHAIHKKDDPQDVLDDAEIPGGTPDWLLAVPLLLARAEAEGFRLAENTG